MAGSGASADWADYPARQGLLHRAAQASECPVAAVSALGELAQTFENRAAVWVAQTWAARVQPPRVVVAVPAAVAP
jgi:hypothetical protein